MSSSSYMLGHYTTNQAVRDGWGVYKSVDTCTRRGYACSKPVFQAMQEVPNRKAPMRHSAGFGSDVFPAQLRRG